MTDKVSPTKILSTNFIIERHIPSSSNWLKRLLRLDLPETLITFHINLADGTVIKTSTVIKGYPTLDIIKEAKTLIEDRAYLTHEQYVTGKVVPKTFPRRKTQVLRIIRR